MNRFVLFFRRYHPLLMFVVLQALAINFYARHSTSYNNSRLLSTSNIFTGAIHEGFAGVRGYLHLKGDNRAMMAEIARLHNTIARLDTLPNLAPAPAAAPYAYTTARVVNNTTSRKENYFTVNRGAEDGVELKSAIISPSNVALGYVLATSPHYAVCMSMLNTQMHTSGVIKGTQYVGSLLWDGRSAHHITMTEVSRYATPNKGDTILTTDYSSIFPPDAFVGTIEAWKKSDNASYLEIKVRLAADFTALRDVLVVKYMDAYERTQLENDTQHQARY